jgi:aerobic-type carbon monoxide dehydrogenase small subunit (CoxS/CutS family)
MASYSLSINGEPKTVEAPEDMPLLWVLRDLVGLTGPKYGCGVSQCRACTVLLDGVETPSCQLAIGEVGKKKITTIEGLTAQREPGQSKEAVVHAIQQSWIEEDVPQCGYCQPGQILTAYALLKRIPKPSDDDIDAAMTGNICRCGTYNRIREAIHRAAEYMHGGSEGGAK